MERRLIPTSRKVAARLVPTGDPITIPSGVFVTLTQTLGGAYTVIYEGNMARIDGEDADALGLIADKLEFELPDSGEVSPEHILKALSSVYDPEIPVNIVDLGLIYEYTTVENRVDIRMTLTAPGCGMGPVLVQDIERRVGKVPFVEKVNVELIFDPPWSRDMMSEEAQLELGLF